MQLLEYWPPVLREIREFREIASAEQPEAESAADAVFGLADELFMDSMGERSIERWEKILNLVPDAENERLEERRQRVVNVYNTQIPFTGLWLKNWLNEVAGKENYVLDLDRGAYRCDVLLTAFSDQYQTQLREALRKILPANLSLTVMEYRMRYKQLEAYAKTWDQWAALGLNWDEWEVYKA